MFESVPRAFSLLMATTHSLRDPELRRLRALRMIEARIKGKSQKDIALEFGVSQDTVERTLSWAKKAELVVEAEDKILRELLPAAHKAITAVLTGDDDEVKAKTALEIFKSTLPSFAKKSSHTGASVGSESDLSSYITSLRGAAGVADRTLDGEVLGSGAAHALPEASEGGPRALLTAGEASDAAQSLPAAAAGHGSAVEPAGNAVDGK